MMHTLGPWRQKDTLGYNDTEIYADDRLVAQVRDGDRDGPLIAAAPDMLRVLKDVLVGVQWNVEWGDAGRGRINGLKLMVEHVIAKAEGKD